VAAPAAVDFIDHGLRCRLAGDVVDHYVSPGLPECDGNRISYPGTGSGNERFLALEKFEHDDGRGIRAVPPLSKPTRKSRVNSGA
jgi:hypothetical protein